MNTRYCTFPTPLGPMFAVAGDAGLVRLDFLDAKYARPIDEAWQQAPRDPTLHACAVQLGEYFAGTRRDFDLPLAPRGTPYQERVWQQIAGVPFGATISYGELARRASGGSPRAAGTATGRNPIAIVVPCHRIVAADGRLTGYAGGIERKTWMLEKEGVLLPGATALPAARV